VPTVTADALRLVADAFPGAVEVEDDHLEHDEDQHLEHDEDVRVDVVAIRRYLEVLHPSMRWNGALAVSSIRDGRWITEWPTGFHEAAQVAAQLAAAGEDVYVGIATRQRPLGSGKRGGAADCLSLPAVFADIDYGPTHDNPNVPADRDAALALVDKVPIRPTMTVDSGYGLHVYWGLDTPTPAARARRLLACWKTLWTQTATDAGVHVDLGVFDLGRVLRVAGTINYKHGDQRPVVILDADPARRYTADELEEYAPVTTSVSGGTTGHWKPLDRDQLHPADLAALEALERLGGHSPFVSDGAVCVTRPGKVAGTSATVGYIAPGVVKVWTPNWPGLGENIYDADQLTAIANGETPTDDRRPDRGADPHADRGHQEVAERPELDRAALYGLAGDVVRTIEPHSEADPAALLVSFLAAFGNAVGSGPHARADGADHPARISPIVVGASSKARKGTAWRNVRRILAAAEPDWADFRILSGLSSGEGLIAAVADPTEDKDGNPVGGVDDKRLFVIEEEFARVLTVAGRDGNTLSALVRQAWDTGDLRTMTKTPLAATGAHITITGHITIEELQAKLTETDRANGLANRFAFVFARRSKRLPEGGNLADDEVDRLARLVRHRLAAAANVGRLERTDDAKRRWADLYHQLADDDPGGLLGAVTARAEAQLLRFSVVYALTDGSDEITVEHLEAAWALWRYCRDSAAYIFGDRLGDDYADRLLAALRQAGADGLDGSQQSAVFGRHASSKELARARQLLERKGLARTVTEATGGRSRTITYAVMAKKANQAKEGGE
jgi:hypothetical protein